MKKFLPKTSSGFHILHSTSRSQLTSMTLAPSESTGGPDNHHHHADQWVFVITGNGQTIINGQTTSFNAGDLLLIEATENHEIKNTGKKTLETLNLYAPPEY